MATESNVVDEGKSVKNQYIAAIVINIMTFTYGCAEGWVSPFISAMSSETETPLDVPLTITQASLVGSMLCIGGLAGTPVFGMIADNFGRKKAALFSAIPCVLSWIMKLTWRTATGIMIARMVAGFSGAGPFLVGSLYCVEIASLTTKGVLGSLMIFSINGGILAMYIMGAYFGYTISALITISLPILFFVIMLKMPETPIFLVKQKRDKEAAEAIAWLRSEPLDSPVVKRVLGELKRESELANKNKNEDTSMKEISSQKNISPWKFFFTSAPTLKAFAVCFILLTVQFLTGIFAIITYANKIFKIAGSTLSPSINSIIVGLLQLLGSILASFVIEKTGRKLLLISSCAILATANAILGTYFYAANKDYDVSSLGWIPVTALSFVVFSFSMGIGPIPYLLPAEIIMVQGRGIASSIMLSWVWIGSFTIAHTFQLLVEMLGSHVVFWTYAACTSIGILVTLTLLPETKGKSFESNLAFYCSKKEREALTAPKCRTGDL